MREPFLRAVYAAVCRDRLSTWWSGLDVKLDPNGAISLIRRIYLEITHFTLLPTEVTGRDVPWLVCYLFFLTLVQGTYLTTKVLLHQCSMHVCAAWKLAMWLCLKLINIFV